MQRIKTLFIFSFLISCSPNNDSNLNSNSRDNYQKIENYVSVIALEKSVFKKQLMCDGKIYSDKKSTLNFNLSGTISDIYVKNGDKVVFGQKIASLNKENYKREFDKVKINLVQAKLDFQDFLFSQGYDFTDTSSMPSEKLEVAKVRSGYSIAYYSLKKAERDLNSCDLLAPFDGVIADVAWNEYELISLNNSLCKLIDNNELSVEFYILETELTQIINGKSVTIQPYSIIDTQYDGIITEINPSVNDNGLIKVKAKIKNVSGILLDGMNVKVIVETKIDDQFIVPKSAVLIRDDQEILFKYNSKDSTAYWTYIKVLEENYNSYAISGHPEKNTSLIPGDTIITSGNFTLAHDTKVIIR
jgi:RND family efflux transporter MFP subunit